MQKNNRSLLEKEYHEFLQGASHVVPKELTESVLTKIQEKLNPSILEVFLKVSLIHLIVGLITVLFCPQFGISVTSSHGIMPFLMKFGESACMFGCGAIFLGASFFSASVFLKPEEVRALRSHRVFQSTLILSISLGSFLCLGADVFTSLALIWILGALVGGLLLLELGWKLRLRGRAV